MATVDQEQLLAAQQEIMTKMANLRTELREVGERLFKEGSQDLFDAFPNLKSFSWTQYTPYFNDGDPCEFSAHTDYLNFRFVDESEKFVDDDVDEDDWYDEDEDNMPWELRARPDSQYFREPENDDEVAMLAVHRLANSVDQDTLRDLFGDHVKVTVSRDGIDVSDYDHD